MPVDPSDPIVRFRRWLATLSPRDWLVVTVLSPALGLASVIGPAWLSASIKPPTRDLLSYSIERLAFGPAILCLFVAGAIAAFLSRRLGAVAASTAMLCYFVWPWFDLASGAGGHNLLPFEYALYCFLTAFAVTGSAVVVIVRRERPRRCPRA